MEPHFDIICERLRVVFPKPKIREVHKYILEIDFHGMGKYLVHYFNSDYTYCLEFSGAMVLSDVKNPNDIVDFMII